VFCESTRRTGVLVASEVRQDRHVNSYTAFSPVSVCTTGKGHFWRLGSAASHVSVLTDLQSEEKVQMVEKGTLAKH